ncbi:MAG: class I SAM-dependent methyltransferase [Thermoproteota archaeon]|nr:class I SAM-dependent methyltransferase [Thermoproteota archaeon]
MNHKESNDELGKEAELDRVAFYGRTLLEYQKFFKLSDPDLLNFPKIIDCPAGASSFVSEMYSRKNYDIEVVGCDPIFGTSMENLKSIGYRDISYVTEKVSSSPNFYNWDFYKSIDFLKNQRTLALEKFLSDYNQGLSQKRYLKASLPNLPFDDKTFDLVLSGHFLFTYSNKFDLEFHVSSILELFRICSRQVRIYPIQQRSSKPYPFMDEIYSKLKEMEIKFDIVTVPFEFQKGSNKMLLLERQRQG